MTTAILDAPLAAGRDSVRRGGNDDRLLRLCALDRLPKHRRRLVCHWQHGADGRLHSVWEPEILLPPHC
jgi:hypothetical protein